MLLISQIWKLSPWRSSLLADDESAKSIIINSYKKTSGCDISTKYTTQHSYCNIFIWLINITSVLEYWFFYAAVRVILYPKSLNKIEKKKKNVKRKKDQKRRTGKTTENDDPLRPVKKIKWMKKCFDLSFGKQNDSEYIKMTII